MLDMVMLDQASSGLLSYGVMVSWGKGFRG